MPIIVAPTDEIDEEIERTDLSSHKGLA